MSDNRTDVAQTNLGARISRGIVGLLKEHYGRGPVGAKTYIHDDIVFVVVHGGFSSAEATLLAAGAGQSVENQRAIFQEAMRERFCELIETETGRKVVSFMGANDQSADASAELFLLDSRPDERASRRLSGAM